MTEAFSCPEHQEWDPHGAVWGHIVDSFSTHCIVRV